MAEIKERKQTEEGPLGLTQQEKEKLRSEELDAVKIHVTENRVATITEAEQ